MRYFHSICLLIIFVALSKCNDDIVKAFKDNEVTPDVISIIPDGVLEVRYPSGNEVKLGNELAPRDVKEIPEIRYDADPDSFYTLILTDPDAPSRRNPTRREWNHWLVVNIPGSKVYDGEVINEYVGSGPPKDSGLHRYIFLVYKQIEKMAVDEQHHSNTDPNRQLFSVEKFAEKYELGVPIAGNFYLAQYDDSVPELYKQLGL